MKRNKVKIIVVLVTILSLVSIGMSIYAHSGKTDSSGGHRDNKNKSGLGSYHYHCGGHPAHLHTNGECPYTSNSKYNKSSASSSTSTEANTKNVTKISYNVSVTGIKINETIQKLELGEHIELTTTITPSNATDKTITWESSNENIATVSGKGKITAKSAGTVDIIATSSNGKTDKIRITINKPQKDENSAIIKTAATTHSITNNMGNNQKDSTSPLWGILMLGVLGCGGYYGYSRYKKK